MKIERSIREGLRQLPIRPVYLISMENDGEQNIITIGMFAFFSGNPSLVGIGVKPNRHSYSLIQGSQEYVVNVVDDKLMGAVRICGERSGRDCDKFRLAQLTPVKGTNIQAPHIKESPLSIECKVVQEVKTGDHIWFIGEVQAVHVDKSYKWQQGLLFKWVGKEGFFYEIGAKKGKY
ncbi:MAG: flavin reductase family protein [Candidatus Bathyarchaeota archaeon]|nr:MAG: flavin reductase family protein [Candidatus Bathyarchaeota archaeon]